MALTAAFCIGMSKAGFGGILLVSVFLMAELYGVVPWTGIMLPLLIVADLAVRSFRQHGSWKPVPRLSPPPLP